MAETVNQETETTAGGQEKTFTQAELNAIVAERLGRERAKYEGFEDFKAKAEKYDQLQEASKSDLQKAQEESADWKSKYEALNREITARNIRDKISKETGVPADCLTGETEEACKAQADAILKFRGDKPKYPDLQDGGEPRHSFLKKQMRKGNRPLRIFSFVLSFHSRARKASSFCSSSSAPASSVGVISPPPLMRASSLLRPSLSSGRISV